MNRIAEIRESLAISQVQLGQVLGWRQSRISNYEQEIRIPSLADCRKIVNALNQFGASVSLDTVFPPAEH